MYDGAPAASSGVTACSDGGAAAGDIGSGWTVVVVVVVPVIAEASLRIASTAPVPTSTMAANTPAVTRIWRYHAPAAWRRPVVPCSDTKSTRGRAAVSPAGASEPVGARAMSGPSSTSDQAIARNVADCTGDATAVRLSSSGRRTAIREAPWAAVSSG